MIIIEYFLARARGTGTDTCLGDGGEEKANKSDCLKAACASLSKTKPSVVMVVVVPVWQCGSVAVRQKTGESVAEPNVRHPAPAAFTQVAVRLTPER